MPQAIERSLATPITSPLLPFISGAGSAISLVVVMASSLVASGSLCSPNLLPVTTPKHERGVGAAEAEAVGHDVVDVDIVLTLAHDRHVGHGGIDGLDVGGFANEAVVHHQQRINRLMCAGGAERMAGERLGGADRRRLVAEHLA